MNRKALFFRFGLLAVIVLFSHAARAVTLQPGDILVVANIGSPQNDAVVEVDPTTGNRTVISSNTVGTGPAITGGTSISFASDGSIILTGQQSLERIDPVTGNRSIISSTLSPPLGTVGTGPTNSWDSGVQFGNQIVLSGGALLYVDPVTGNRTSVPGGDSLSSVGVIPVGSDLIISNTGSLNDIVMFDPTTGTQTIISGNGVGNGPAIVTPTGIVFDGLGNILAATSPSLFAGEVLKIDPLTGDRAIVSGGGVGTGPSMAGLGAQIAVEPNGMILAADGGYANLLQIDPTTGNRTVLSGSGVGTGPVWLSTGLGAACAVVPAPEPSSLTLLAIAGISLAGLARRRSRAARLPSKAKIALLFVGFFGTLDFTSRVAQAVALQPGDIVVTTEFTSSDLGLMIVDPVTGARTILSDNTHGTGPNFTSPTGVTVLPNGDLLVGDGNAQTSLKQSRLIEVDPTTGNRTVISGSGVGSGPNFQQVIGGLSFGNSIVAVDQQLGALVNVDPVTGNRAIISGAGVGSGPVIGYPGGAVVTGTNAVLVDYLGNQLLSINLTSGDRSILSGPGVGSGPSFAYPNDVVLGVNNNLIADDSAAIYSIDPVTGNRTIISSSTVGSGPIWNGLDPWGIASAPNGTIVMAAIFSGALYTIDPITGNRAILADATHGSGVSFLSVSDPVVIPNVPEPSSIVLLAIGAVGLSYVLRRARHRN